MAMFSVRQVHLGYLPSQPIRGVPEVVRNGENGYVLPYSARGYEYARIIAEIYQDDQRYTALVESSRAAFESRTNWDVWGSAVKQVLQDIINRTPLNRKVGGESLREIVQETGR